MTCKLIKGLCLQDSREEVRRIVEADAAYTASKKIITVSEDPSQNVVQVD